MLGFSASDVVFCRDVPLSSVSTIKIGGNCRMLAYPKNENALISLLSYLDKRHKAYRVIGCLSNTLPTDDEYKTVLISTKKMRSVRFSEDRVTVAAGARPLSVAKEGIRIGVLALSGLSTVPGTIGAGVRGNAGAFGATFADSFLSATLYDPTTASVFSVGKREMDFSYRNSMLKERPYVLVNATFETKIESPEIIRDQITGDLQKRKATQPHGEPSLGSAFLKNENGEAVSYYIDHAGLKGFRVGGISVSEKHAGFLINCGGGTSEDYKSLVYFIRRELKNKYGFTARCEIEFL